MNESTLDWPVRSYVSSCGSHYYCIVRIHCLDESEAILKSYCEKSEVALQSKNKITLKTCTFDSKTGNEICTTFFRKQRFHLPNINDNVPSSSQGGGPHLESICQGQSEINDPYILFYTMDVAFLNVSNYCTTIITGYFTVNAQTRVHIIFDRTVPS